MGFPCNVGTAPSPWTHQSIIQWAKVFLMVTEARPYLPEQICVWTPKSLRLSAYIGQIWILLLLKCFSEKVFFI